MHIHKRNIALIAPILALTGCANVTGGRAGLPDRWRTIVSANGATSPTETGPSNARVAADLGVPEPREAASGRISGRVVDDQGRPVPSADVRLADGTSRSGRVIRDVTDPAGGFTLKGLRPGEAYTLIAERDNGRAFLVGRAKAEAPDAAVKITLLDPETAEAQPQDEVPSRSRVGRVSSRAPVETDAETLDAADPFLDDDALASPPRSPRTSRAPRVNVDDLPPAEEAENLDLPEPRTASREPRPIWRKGTATSDPEVATTTTAPDSDPAPSPSPPARTVEPAADEPPPSPPVEPARPVIEEEEVNPLPPAKERPIDPLPSPPSSPSPSPAPAPEADPVPSLPPPSVEPDPVPPQTLPEPEPEPEPQPAPTAEPSTSPRSLDPPPVDAVPAEPLQEVPPEVQPDPAPQTEPSSPAATVAISAATAPRRKPTWGELTREASSSPSAAPAVSTIPISTRRLPVKANDPEESRGSRLLGLFAGKPRGTNASETSTEIMASSCRYDSKTQRIMDFRLPDLDGKPVNLSDLDADYILLDFWGTWCKPCRESIPKLVELQTIYGASRLRVVGIASEEVGTSPQSQVQSVDEVARSMGINYPLLMSGLDGKPCPLQEALHIQAYPTMILLDRTGRILWRGTGAETSTLNRLDRVIAARADAGAGVVRR